MAHASSTYHVSGPEKSGLRLSSGGERRTVPAADVAADPSPTAFAYRFVFGAADPATVPASAALQALGAAIMSEPVAAFAESDIPAGYTYLGQLIFHDITFMSPGRKINFRSPALDLDSIFPSAELLAQTPPFGLGPLPVGRTTSEGIVLAEDLPRVREGINSGQPLIQDPRNDDFLPLAQCHLTLLKFYNAIARNPRNGAAANIRETWVKHFQHLVLHDFAPRIVGRETYEAVLNDGRRLVAPGCIGPSTEWMPLEFAVACGRYGHSMIRDDYSPWNRLVSTPVGVRDFMDLSFRNSIDGLADNNRGLPIKWVTNWFRLFDFAQHPLWRDAGEPMKAGRIGTRFTHDLASLPERIRARPPNAAVDAEAFNLATASLLRGREVGIASAQQAFNFCRGRGLNLRQLSTDELIAGETASVRDAFRRHDALGRHTPLWYYVLREAALLGDGNHLGPLGGRVVMETLHAAIEAGEISILKDADWRPHLPSVKADDFTIVDLIAFAGHPNPLETV
jgi:hypothetical protein